MGNEAAAVRKSGGWPGICVSPQQHQCCNSHDDTDQTAAERHELPDSAFGIPETREFPLVDAEHVRAAEAYFRYAPDTEKAALARRILAKAAEFGVHVQSPTIRIWAEKP